MATTVGKVSMCCSVVLGVLLLLTGCAGGGSQAVLDLVPLQVQMVAEYGASKIIVELQDGNSLGVMLVHPASNEPTAEPKIEQAREIAEFVCQHYGSMERIDQVRVALETREDGSMADASAAATFSFAEGDLACGGR